YYKTLASLDGLDLDFGYEFIEAGWALDFSPGDDPAKSPPWQAAQGVPGKRGSEKPAKSPMPIDPALVRASPLRSPDPRPGQRQGPPSAYGDHGTSGGTAMGTGPYGSGGGKPNPAWQALGGSASARGSNPDGGPEQGPGGAASARGSNPGGNPE